MTDLEPRPVLALNSGSSSLKFGLYRAGPVRTEELLSGEAEAIGEAAGKFSARNSRGDVLASETAPIPTQREAVIRVGRLLAESGMPAPGAVGHRIVHGGPQLLQHCLIDDAVLQKLEAAAAFAPLHTPAALAVVRFAREHFRRAAAGGVFRHRLSRRLARGGAGAADRQRIAIAGYPALRFSRAVVRS